METVGVALAGTVCGIACAVPLALIILVLMSRRKPPRVDVIDANGELIDWDRWPLLDGRR